MMKRILLPLSGRESDEAVVSLVGALARQSGATVRLLRVFPLPELIMGKSGRVVAYIDQQMSGLTAEGLRYLSTVETRLDGIPMESAVRFGQPAQEIVLEAEAFDADLIALATTNRSWLRNALSPGVAHQVVRKAVTPAVVLRV